MNKVTIVSLTIGLFFFILSPTDCKSVHDPSLIKKLLHLREIIARLTYSDDDIIAPLLETSRADISGPEIWVNYSDPELLWNPTDIPYFIDPSLENFTSAIRIPINEFEKVSCINFRELDYQDKDSWPKDYLHFTNGTGCSSFLGRQGGAQLIIVEIEDCTGSGYGKVMHLIFHALGFPHEHNRPDRTAAINIDWKLVNETKRQYLTKYNGSDALTYGEPYDYGSLLHGNNYLFSVNKTQKTIVARNDSSFELGQRQRFSESDIRRLNARYPCPTTTEETTTTTTTGASTTENRCEASEKEPSCNGETRPTLADPHDCTRYYVCQRDIVGYQLIQMPCPEGLIYNSTIYVCDYPRNTVCCSSQQQTKHLNQKKRMIDVVK